jgi:hypothetical protein
MSLTFLCQCACVCVRVQRFFFQLFVLRDNKKIFRINQQMIIFFHFFVPHIFHSDEWSDQSVACELKADEKVKKKKFRNSGIVLLEFCGVLRERKCLFWLKICFQQFFFCSLRKKRISNGQSLLLIVVSVCVCVCVEEE